MKAFLELELRKTVEFCLDCTCFILVNFLQSSHQLSDHRSSRSVSVPAPSSSFEGGRPALPVRSQWGSRPSSLTGISRDVLDRVLDEPDLPDSKSATRNSYNTLMIVLNILGTFYYWKFKKINLFVWRIYWHCGIYLFDASVEFSARPCNMQSLSFCCMLILMQHNIFTVVSIIFWYLFI